MSVFEDIEKTIERGFRKWTEKLFGAAQSDELLLVHRAILEEIESKVQFAARGRRIFPYPRVRVTLHSPDADRRALYQAAFGEQLERDIREMLEATHCEMPRRFGVDVTTGEGDRPFEISYDAAATPSAPAAVETPVPVAAGPVRVLVVRGKAEQAEYVLTKVRTNIGRMAELTDSEQRVLRRNDIVFEDGADDANATVSRRHAHIKREGDEYRVCDDESEYGTRVFRDGRPIEVPAGNRRGEKLRPGDEIYVGRACLRFEA
jgi:hypothetical protein